MNCPNCQTPTELNQKFCRSCGANLQVITQPLAQPVVPALPETSLIATNKWRRVLPVWGFVIMFLGLMMSIISVMLPIDRVVTLSGVLTSVIGMFMIGLPSVLSLSRSSNPQKQSLPPETNHLLPPENHTEYVPSVTERTTNLLNYPIATEIQRQPSGGLRS